MNKEAAAKNPEEFTVFPITVKDSKGNIAEDVSPGILEASAQVYNPGTERNVTLFMCMQDNYNDKMNYVQMKNVAVPNGYSVISDTIDMEQLSNYSAYTKYMRAFVIDNASGAMLTEQSKKVGSLPVKGIVSDIWISEKTKKVRGLVLVHHHGIGVNIKGMKVFKELCEKSDLAIMSLVDEKHELTAFEDCDKCGKIVLDLISEYAKTTGHPELESVPLATFGHSNSTCFAARFANWIPERMFAIIAFKSAYAHQIEYDNIAKYKIPMLIITGEYDYSYGYHGQIYAAERMLEGGGLIQYVQDPGAGHGTNMWKSNTIVFEFLKAAAEMKISHDGTLLDIDAEKGYFGYGTHEEIKSDRTYEGYVYKFIPEGYMTYDEYLAAKAESPDFKAQAYLFNEDYAKKWIEFNQKGIIHTDYEYKDAKDLEWG